MTAVGTDVDWAAPSAFRAVTRERIVLSTSTFFSTYVFSVAPPIVAQLPPSLSQRRHWYVNVVGVPLHVPLLVVSVLPSWAVPEIVGGDVVPRRSLRGGRPARLGQTGDRREQEQRAHCGQPEYLQFPLACLPFPRMGASRSFSPVRTPT